MNLISTLITNGPDILVACGVAITALAVLPITGWILLVTARLSVSCAAWRKRRLQEKRDSQALRLEMAARERAFHEAGSSDKIGRQEKEIEAAKREIHDLRRLHTAQEEVLTARQIAISVQENKVRDLEAALEEMESSGQEAENRAHEAEVEREKLREEANELTEKLQEKTDEIAQRESLIRLLEGQVSTHQQSAAMANANASDLQRELEQKRREIQTLTEKVALLERLNQAVNAQNS